MSKANRQNIIVKSLLILIILVQLACMSIVNFTSRPSGDEWFTYGLANNTDGKLFMDLKWINNKTNGTGWLPTELFKDYLLVNEGEEFSFDVVVENQKKDVHPPLYYLLIHFLCSFTADKVILIQGGVVNLVFLVAVNIILWHMGKDFFQSKYERLLPLLVLCLSISIRILFSYDRMYTMLAFFCICITYLQIRLRKDGGNKRILLAVSVVTCLGMLTHYYFYMYLAAAFVTFCIERILISKERIRTLVPYVLSHCIGGIVALILYPKAISHILFSYRGEEIRNSLFEGKGEGFKAYYHIIDEYCFSGHLLEFVLIVLLIGVIGFFVNKKNVKIKDASIFILVVTSVFYYAIISFISYEKVWSYISPIFVPAAFIIAVLMIKALHLLSQKYAGMIAVLGVLVILGAPIVDGVADAIDTHQYNKEIDNLASTQAGKDCIFIYKDWNNLFDNRILELMNYDEVFVVDLDDIHEINLNMSAEQRKSADEIVIYLYDPENNDENEIITYLEDIFGKEMDKIINSRKYSVFSLN